MTLCHSLLLRWGALSLFVSLMLAPVFPSAAAIPESGQPASAADARAQDLETVRRVLEVQAVKQRLGSIGLSPEEADRKLNRLSDSQLHRLAGTLDALIPAGSVDGTLHTVLLALLVFLTAVVIVILV